MQKRWQNQNKGELENKRQTRGEMEEPQRKKERQREGRESQMSYRVDV